MAEYIFGSGTVVAKRTDVANQPPALLGVLQEVTLDFSRKIESLIGQYVSPVAFGGGELEIKGKCKSGRFQAATFNNMFLSGTQVANSGLEMVVAEAVTPSGGSFTVANHTGYVEDLGLFYAATGQQLLPVATAPGSAGSYEAGIAGAGTYTLNAADNGVAMLVYYSYTVATEQQITLNNQLMGPIPTFELMIKESFTVFGVAKSIVIKLNACVSEKLSLGFTNTKFSIPEMDIMAGADAANNIGTISMTE